MDKQPPPRPAVIVHGGAWAIPDAEWPAHRAGVERAVRVAWDIVSNNGSSLDAVEAAIVLMEDDPTYDAGIGSVLTREGHVEMDAAAMDGRDLRVGAVTCVRDVRHPIRLAREVMRSDHVLLAGGGAERFAREHGIETCDPSTFVVDRERKRLAEYLKTTTDPDPKAPFARPTDTASGGRRARIVDDFAEPPGPRGTVGCVAVDRGGNLAAGGSTGGTPGKPSGRVGDTPIAGAGLWADNREGAAACTGWGEGILRVGLARTAVSYLRESTAQDAAYLAIREMESRVDGRAGVILLSRDGSIGFAFNTPRMAVAYMDEELALPWVR